MVPLLLNMLINFRPVILELHQIFLIGIIQYFLNLPQGEAF